MVTIESEPRVVNVSAGATLNVILEFLNVDMVCDLNPSIGVATSGLSIISPPEGGLPTDIGKLLINMDFGPACRLWDIVPQPFPQMERIFPLPVEVTIAGVTSSMSINGPDAASYDFTSNIMNLILGGTINETTETIAIVVKYPTKKTYNILDPSKYTFEFAELTATVPINILLPVPIICKPSAEEFTAPTSIPIGIPDLMSPPTLDLTSFPISANMVAPCVPTGIPDHLFPMDLNLIIDDGVSEYIVLASTDASGNYAADIINTIRGWMATKTLADLDKLSGINLKLQYHGKVEFENVSALGVWSELKRAEQWISIELLYPPPIICTPSAEGFTAPTSIPIGIPTNPMSPPTLDLTSFPVSANMIVPCVPAGIPDHLFPMDLNLIIDDGVSEYIVLVRTDASGNYAADIINTIRGWMATKTLADLDKLSGINLKLQYHGKVEFENASALGVWSELKRVELRVPITIAEIPDIFCDLAVSTTDPGLITFKIPTFGGPPTLSSPIPINATFRAVCDNSAPADLLEYIDAEVYVNNILFGTFRPDIGGRIGFDLATNTTWLSSIRLGDPTMELKIRFPRQLKCSIPTPHGEYQEHTSNIRIDVTVAEPECVLTDEDYYTCPDSTVIQLNECVNDVKVPIVPTPTCPEIPPECVLDAADFFTCPDSTVIQLNECVNGVKVPIVPTPTCPEIPEPEPIVCNITNVVEKEQLNVTISELGIITAGRCDIDVQLYVDACGKSMTEILAVTGGYLNLNHADGTRFASIPLDIYGEGMLDISPYALSWLLSLTEIPTTLYLVLVCPSKVTFSTPTAEYVDVPVLVGIQVTEPKVTPECVLDAADFFTCPDSTVIQLNECVNDVKVPIVPTPTCPEIPPECVLDAADFFTCPDGTVIQLNECVNGVKVPIVPTPTCPPVPEPEPPAPAPPAVGRSMVMAVTNMAPEGKTVDIVVQSLCAGVESDGEDATLKVDDAAIQTRPTKEGEVSFRWVATGVGTRMVCVEIPAGTTCPYPGAVCRQVKVVTYLPEVKEQVAEEMSAYESELYKLRKVREIERDRLRGIAVSQGTVRIPTSLAGSTVEIGGVPRVVPPEGITVTVPAGENVVTIITEGVREAVPVLVLPGETEILRGL